MPYAEYQLAVDDELNPFDEDTESFGSLYPGDKQNGDISGRIYPIPTVRKTVVDSTGLTQQQQDILNIRNTGTAVLQNPSSDNSLLLIGGVILLGYLVMKSK